VSVYKLVGGLVCHMAVFFVQLNSTCLVLTRVVGLPSLDSRVTAGWENLRRESGKESWWEELRGRG
jgi:hypothetical protein